MTTHATARAGLALAIGLASIPAWGQEVTFADLDGLVIDATIVRNQVARREGRQALVQVTQVWKIVVGPGESIETTVTSTAQTPRGLRKSKPRTGTLTLGQPQEVVSMGGGTAAWEFNDGTLTFLRTFKQGAYRANFALARSAEGLACSVDEIFAREGGRGALVMESAVESQLITVISSKQVSSTCRVSSPTPAGVANTGPASRPREYEELTRDKAQPPRTTAPSRRRDSKTNRRGRNAAPDSRAAPAQDRPPSARIGGGRGGRGAWVGGPPGSLRGTGIGRRCRQGDAAACQILRARCNAGGRGACAALGR